MENDSLSPNLIQGPSQSSKNNAAMYIDISEFHSKPPHITSLNKIKLLILIGLTLTKK